MDTFDEISMAILITRGPEPVGMYRGHTLVSGDTVRFRAGDGELELALPGSWLETARPVPEEVTADLGHADRFITVDAADWAAMVE